MKRIVFYIILLFIVTSCGLSEEKVNRNINFNKGWRFLEDSTIQAHSSNFDDSLWRIVDLPHDWSIEDYPVQDSLHIGPFCEDTEFGHDFAHLRGGTGWYRKTLTIPAEKSGKLVFIHFDGVHSESELFVNGVKVGEHKYGYTPFFFNITPYLNPVGKANVIAMRVDNPQPNSRWFTGAGIYRDASISYLNPVHIDVWGLYITTPKCNPEKSDLQVQVNLTNSDTQDANITVAAKIIAPNKSPIELEPVEVSIKSGLKATVTLSKEVLNPMLWDIDSPNLYHMVVSVLSNGVKVDSYEEVFGFRSIEFSSLKGFLLNGREVLLRGGNIHHDNGLLGAAAFQRAEERKVQFLKKSGFNAIRAAHNPNSMHFYRACAEQGMLLINESFDAWVVPNRAKDYHLHFNDWWEKDLSAMLLSSRNNPAIIMWSIGNEIIERAQPIGLELAKKQIELVKQLDPTRPTTMGVNDTWDNPGMTWEDLDAIFDLLDVCGYNYQPTLYERDHVRSPDRIMYGSETFPGEPYLNLQLMNKLPYVIGEFVWTAMDYLGEAGVAKSSYQIRADTLDPFNMPWPWYTAWMGDIDLIGNKKPQSYYRDVVWGNSRMEMLVHELIPDGAYEQVFYWGWPKEYKSWSWEGNEDMGLIVNVYSNYPQVRLELNGDVIGIKELNENDEYPHSFDIPIWWRFNDWRVEGEHSIGRNLKFSASFLVPYQAGELKAIGMENGNEVEVKILKSAGHATALRLTPEQKNIKADRSEIAYIKVEAVDSNGMLVPNANLSVTANVSGAAELIAAGNASPFIQGSMQSGIFNLYNGKGLIIIRSDGNTGNIEINISADELISKTIIKSVKKVVI